MDSALAARSTASSFRLTAGPRDRGSRRVATSRPAFQVHAQRTKGRTTLRQACPPIHALRPQPGLEVRTKLVRLIGTQTRVASPSVLAPRGIKRRSKDLRAGSLGQVAARCRDSPHVTTSATDRKSTRLNSSHMSISYAVFCLK